MLPIPRLGQNLQKLSLSNVQASNVQANQVWQGFNGQAHSSQADRPHSTQMQASQTQANQTQANQTQLSRPSLTNTIGQTYILAYKELTQPLENALSQSGLPAEVLRQTDRPEYQPYAAIYRCMLNHHQAWQRAAQSNRPSLIVEADFVPVMGLGQLPLPFQPDQPNVGMAWLYTCASQLYSVTSTGFGEGFSTGLVAYVLTPQAALALCDFVDQITQAHGTGYFTFDSEIDCFLRVRGFKNYIGFRNYGEHGGKPNPEHRRHQMSGIHRADVLYGKLAFMPAYAASEPWPQLAFWFARGQARCKGLGRLLLGKFLRRKVVQNSSTPLRLLRFALRRHLVGHL
jgi:hypothetical protein